MTDCRIFKENYTVFEQSTKGTIVNARLMITYDDDLCVRVCEYVRESAKKKTLFLF